jgi:hypothetical protein
MKTLLLMVIITLLSYGNIGTIMVLKGEAQILRETKIQAKMGMKVKQYDRIRTSVGSIMQIILKDDTVITIGSDSSLDFKAFTFDGSPKSQFKAKVNRGFFRSVTGKIGKIAPSRFKVKTVSATIGVRGTDFSVTIDDDEEKIECYSGAIWVRFERGGIKNILPGMLLSVGKKGIHVQRNRVGRSIKSKTHHSNKAPKKHPPIYNNMKPPKAPPPLPIKLPLNQPLHTTPLHIKPPLKKTQLLPIVTPIPLLLQEKVVLPLNSPAK